MNKKEFKLLAFGYGTMITFWLLMIAMSTIALVLRWSEYSAVGETANHMPYAILIGCTVLVPFGWIMAILGACFLIHELKIMYNNLEVK